MKAIAVIGFAALLMVSFGLAVAGVCAVTGVNWIPGLDPHWIPGLDPHWIPGLDPHWIPGLDPH